MATSSDLNDSKRRRKRKLPVLPISETGRHSTVLKEKFEIPEFDVERLHNLPHNILSQINKTDNDKTLLQGQLEDLRDTDLMKTGKKSQITLKSGKKLDISLVEGSFRRIAGIREQADDSGSFIMRTIEIQREPGKSLGFYIRQGDGWFRKDGIFVSRVNLGSLVDTNSLLHVGDEIVKVNQVDVTSLSLDDVVVIMQYVKRLVLTVKILTSVTLSRTLSQRKFSTTNATNTIPSFSKRSTSYAEKIAMKQSDDVLMSTNVGINPYEEIEIESSKELSVNKKTQESDSPYEEVGFGKHLDHKNTSHPSEALKFDTNASSDVQVTQQPLASSTPVQHHKLDTSSPQRTVSAENAIITVEEEIEKEHTNELADSDDAPPTSKPPPPPAQTGVADNRENLNLSSKKVISSPKHFNQDSSDSVPPPIPSPLVDVVHLDMDEPPTTKPPPPPNETPWSEDQEDEQSHQTEEPATGWANFDNSDNTSDLQRIDKDKLFSGMLAATLKGMEDIKLDSAKHGDAILCTLAVDSVMKVQTRLRCHSNALEMSLGEELDPFHIDIINSKKVSISVYTGAEQSFEKEMQLAHLFPKSTTVKEVHLPLRQIGELTLLLEYKPMSVFIKRMDPGSSHYDCANFTDFVNSNPSSSGYPLVIERCIQIVEEYGLVEPGLYQRCVSESTKSEALSASISQTKDQAKINKMVLQLSVHAFTGVLKDFFRDLPEPLLTNEISSSLTETASMDNAAMVGADVMQSFIACLPDEVILSLQLILRHFRKVCDHGQANGLSVEQVSQIFGPLLLAPTQKTDTIEGYEYASDFSSQAKVISMLMSMDILIYDIIKV